MKNGSLRGDPLCYEAKIYIRLTPLAWGGDNPSLHSDKVRAAYILRCRQGESDAIG